MCLVQSTQKQINIKKPSQMADLKLQAIKATHPVSEYPTITVPGTEGVRYLVDTNPKSVIEGIGE